MTKKQLASAKIRCYNVEQDKTSTAEDIYAAHEAVRLIEKMLVEK